MHLADGTNSWSGRGKLSEWLRLCTQPQETPLGSNKHRNKCTERGLEKKHVPIKQAVTFPSPLFCWALPRLAQLDSSGEDELADRMAKLETLLGGKRRWLGLVWGVAQDSPHTAPRWWLPRGRAVTRTGSSSSPVHRLLQGGGCCRPIGGPYAGTWDIRSVGSAEPPDQTLG